MTAERTTAPPASPPPPVFEVATQDALPLGPQWEEGADFLARISAAKQFTGAGLAADWHRAQCIAACVVAGLSVREIAAGHGCSVNVVTRVLGVVAERAPEVVTAMRKRLSGQMTMLASMLSASMVEDIVTGKLKPEHKPVALGIVATQSALLAGDPTARIERTSAPDAAGLRERLGQILDVETVPSDSVSGAERAELPNKCTVYPVSTIWDTVPTTSAEPIPAVQGPATEAPAERPAGPLEAAGQAAGEGGGVVFVRGGGFLSDWSAPAKFGGRRFGMSYTVEDAAWMVPNLTPTEKLVLLAIAKVLIFETRRAQVTTSWLATLTGLTDRTVQQTCARLESAHLIQVTRHGGRIQNEYRVLFPVNWSRPSKSEGGNPTPKMTTSNPENDDIQPRNPQQPNPENDDTLYEGSTEGYNEHPPVASANPEAASGLDSDSYQSKTAILKEAGKAAPAAEKPFPEIPSPQQVMAAALRIDPLMPKDWVERWEMHCLKKAMASTRGWEACLRMNWQHDAQAGVLRKNAKNGGPAPGQSMAKHNGGRPTVKPKFV